ncbi:hypothetical protein MXD59_10550 [Frankia sp. Ag45/Mut15]|uniref:Fibronectin type-III domain-containing protein n=1 Tax=Frankia umida TaxID=573489 RepID=A0ABT0JXE2_9ACTN|nr:hypothetical protein [Frankia umida]MCK9876210.1 hypothetical protein [Frankia umida]
MPAAGPPGPTLPDFIPDDYRARVLASVHRRGGAEHSDPFEIYDIPLAAVATLTDAQVQARIDEVWAFWQRNRDHPRYRGAIIGLLERHAELAAALADRTTRLALSERVAAARAERDDERFAALDAAARRLVARFGGLPADRLEGLRTWAATQDITAAEFDTRIRRHRVLPAAGTEAATGPAHGEQVSPAVLRQIRSDLDELARIAATTPPRGLFDLLGLPTDASPERIRAARDAALARNRARRPDRRRALLDDLLAAVHTLLVDGDPHAYLDALAADTTTRLRPQVAAAVLVEDALLPAEAARLVAAALADGLDPHRAQAVVRALAREHGVAAPPLPPITEAPASGARSRPGGTAATAGEPDGSTSRPADRSARRPAAGPTQGAIDWRAHVSRARAELRAGRPVAASDHVAAAREGAGETLPPIRAVGDEVEAAIRAAATAWGRLAELAAAARYRAVLDAVRPVVAVAADVPGPGGQLPGELLSLAEARCAAADDLVARARAAATTGPGGTGPGGTGPGGTGPGGAQARSRLIDEALALVADHTEALALRDATAATGGSRPAPAREQGPTPGVVAAPAGVWVGWEAGSVVVRWQASTTPGEVRYRVSRIGADGASRVVGVTSATELADGGASAGDVAYAVSAGLGPVWSPPTRSDAPAEVATVPEAGDGPSTPMTVSLSPSTIGLRWESGRLRWNWPADCAEMVVVARVDERPRSATDPGAFTRRVTSARHRREGGVVLPAERPLHVAVFRGNRDSGRLVIAPTAAAWLRLEPDTARNPPPT